MNLEVFSNLNYSMISSVPHHQHGFFIKQGAALLPLTGALSANLFVIQTHEIVWVPPVFLFLFFFFWVLPSVSLPGRTICSPIRREGWGLTELSEYFGEVFITPQPSFAPKWIPVPHIRMSALLPGNQAAHPSLLNLSLMGSTWGAATRRRRDINGTAGIKRGGKLKSLIRCMGSPRRVFL